jgi:leucine dehydrogenase
LLQRPLGPDVSVAVQGLGAVGMALCDQLAEKECRLVVADIDPARTARAAAKWGAEAVPVASIVAADVDVLAPCALGAVLNPTTVDTERARIIAGAANNQLERLEDGDRLHDWGVFYVPDYLANAGGMVSAAAEYMGSGDERTVMSDIARIAERTRTLIERVQRDGRAPARLVDEWAAELIAVPA